MSKLLTKKLVIPQINEAVINNESLQTNKEKEIIELDNTIEQQGVIFHQAINTLKSEIDEWERKYILSAPIKGKVSFTRLLQENQEVQVTQTICYIKPDSTSCYAEMQIPQVNFGKVRLGQTVLLKFDAYPDAEFGSLVGKIEFISPISTDSGYFSKVLLPNEMKTNFGKEIAFKDGLIASGQILTLNTRLLQRIYYSLYNNIKRE